MFFQLFSTIKVNFVDKMKQRTYLSFILHSKDKRAPILSDLFLRDFYLWVKLKMAANKLVSYQALWVEIQFAKKTNVIC